jgi:hypothetical protein
VAAVLDGVKGMRFWPEVCALDEWRPRMPALEGAWAVVQTPGEVLGDPQVRDNGYVGLDWDAIVALKLNNTVN